MAASDEFDGVLRNILRSYDDKITLRPKQVAAFDSLWMGDDDLIVSVPTGYGKSLIYHLCGRLLRAKGITRMITLVILPLNVIQHDQQASLERHGIKTCKLDIKGNVTYTEDDDMAYDKECETNASVDEISSGKFEVVLAHPEALFCTRLGRQLLDSPDFTENICAIVVDECHTIEAWGSSFRTAFMQVKTLRAFITCPLVALSATLTVPLWKALPGMLGMQEQTVIKETPDKPNMFLGKKLKPPNIDIIDTSESVYVPELRRLQAEGHHYPVTLCYMPLEWCSDAQSYAVELFGEPCLTDTKYAIVFSTQDNTINKHVMKELKKDKPVLRLVFYSSALGMGFDSPCVTRIVHGKPPRTMVEFVQQLGRAGRLGQKSTGLVHYNANDIASNVSGLSDDIREYCTTSNCLRLTMLTVFGYQECAEQLDGCKCCENCKGKCECSTCLENC